MSVLRKPGPAVMAKAPKSGFVHMVRAAGGAINENPKPKFKGQFGKAHRPHRQKRISAHPCQGCRNYLRSRAYREYIATKGVAV